MAEVTLNDVSAVVKTIPGQAEQWVVAGEDNPIIGIPKETDYGREKGEEQAKKIYGKDIKRVKKENIRLPEITEEQKTHTTRGFEQRNEKRELLSTQREQRSQRIQELKVIADKLSMGDDLFLLLRPGDLDKNRYAELDLVREQQGLTIQDLHQIRSAQRFVTRWNAKEAAYDKASQTHGKQEYLERNGLLQRENLGNELLQQREVLMAGLGEQMLKKAQVLVEMQHGYDTVNALTGQGLRLNTQVATAMGLYEGKPGGWQALVIEDAADMEKRRGKYQIKLELTDKLRKTENLTEGEAGERSKTVDDEAKQLVNEINTIRRQNNQTEMNQIEITQLRRNLGVTERIDSAGNTRFDFEENSTIEALLLAKATRLDATVALKENLEAVANKDLDCVEVAYEAANAKVSAESLEIIAHSMVGETVTQQKAEEALAAARKLGLVDEVGRLEKIIGGSKEMVKKSGALVKQGLSLIWEAVKDPEKWKKLGKYLLIGLGASVLLALLIALGMGAVVTSAMGGGGR
jgi:hypothetical protein